MGIEAGLIPVPHARIRYLDQHYAAIVDGEGVLTLGGSPSFEYPERIIEVVRAGVDVERAMERVFGARGIGRREGAVGYLSQGRMSRRELVRESVLMALVPRVGLKFYRPRGIG